MLPVPMKDNTDHVSLTDRDGVYIMRDVHLGLIPRIWIGYVVLWGVVC